MRRALRLLAEHAGDEMGHPSKPFSAAALLEDAYLRGLAKSVKRLLRGLRRLGWLIPLGRGNYLPSPELVDALIYAKWGPGAFTPEGARHVRRLLRRLRKWSC